MEQPLTASDGTTSNSDRQGRSIVPGKKHQVYAQTQFRTANLPSRTLYTRQLRRVDDRSSLLLSAVGPRRLGPASVHPSSTNASSLGALPELTDAQPRSRISEACQRASELGNRPRPKLPRFDRSRRAQASAISVEHAVSRQRNPTAYNPERQSLTMLWSDCPLHVTRLIFAAGGN